MKTILILSLLTVSSVVLADNQFMVDGKPATKVEAMRALLKNPGANVIKACNVEVTDKMTLRCKKVLKTAKN